MSENSPLMAIMRASSYRRMPWKNGGGETFEIAVSPENASLSTLSWRVSMASIAQDGPFSVFPGVDRTLCVLNGEGVYLSLSTEADPVQLSPASDPFSFPADVPVMARLISGPVMDLNVMTRRGHCRQNVRRITVHNYYELLTSADALVVFCVGTDVTCEASGDARAVLQHRDSAIFRSAPRRLELASSQPSTVLLAEFYRNSETR